MAEVISMRFPADTEYLSAIRLAVSGVAGVMDYNLDEIEDLKSCVAEACLLLLCGQKCSFLQIDMEVDEAIRTSVNGVDVRPDTCEDCQEFNEEISRLMIEALSENAAFEEENGILSSISFTKKHSA